MPTYMAFTLINPVQDEDELRNAPPGTVLSEAARERRVERARDIILNAMPRLLSGNKVRHDRPAATLFIKTEQELENLLTELGLHFVRCSD